MKSLTSLVLIIVALVSSSCGQTNNHGTIRLIRSNQTSQTYTSGIVQLYYSNTWGNICADSTFGSTEANVICHQLAYTGASSSGTSTTLTLYGIDNNSTVIEDVNCVLSSYLTLLQCSVRSRYSTLCSTNSLDAYVICYTTRIWSSPFSGQIRLIGGSYSNFGRLEVYCNSQWGTVCDDSFGLTDATVACRQLGYSRSYSYIGHLAGSSSQPIWLDNVPCSSSFTSCLATCQSCPSSQFHNCGHNEDVALGCDSSTSSSTSFTTTSTCQFADISSGSSVAGIIAGIIAFIVVTIVIIVSIPICICCCLGVGLGAAVRGGSRQRVVTTTVPATNTTAAVVTETRLQGDAPPPYAQSANYPASGYPVGGTAPYAQQQPEGYAYPQGYTQQYPGYPQQQSTGYPPQQPAEYPPQQSAGYPPQQSAGYPPQQSAGYPPQQSAGYPPQESGYPPQQAGYPPPQQPGYPPQESGYPPNQPGYPPQ